MTIIRVVDFETSGTEPPAEVCEVGYCDIHLGDDGKVTILEPTSWLCKVKEMPAEVRAIHHISLAECAKHKPFDQDQLNCPDPHQVSAFAAHNSSFETKFFTPDLPMICTYKAALRVWPDAPSHSNGALRYWLEDQGLIAPVHETTLPAHRAGPDAYVTAWILGALFQKNITGRQMVAWTKEPPVMPRCPIGKFRGKPWPEVEAGFLGWMLRQPDMDADLKWNAEREINRRQESRT